MARLTRSITLIGPMGASKSATARILAKYTGMYIFDVDREFEKKYGKIPDFFAEHGEAEFRKKETEIMTEAANRKNTVVSTGGGAVLSRKGMAALRRYTSVVYLTADVEILKKRVKNSTRPLKNDLERLVAERAPLYEKYADFKIDTSNLDLEDTADTVLMYASGSRPNRYTTVLCDADDTLLDFAAAERESITTVLNNCGAYSENAVKLYTELNAKYWARLSRGEITREELLRDRFTEYVSLIGIDKSGDELSDEYRALVRSNDKVIVGASSLLGGLKVRGIKVYVVTNGFAADAKVRLNKLEHLIDEVFTSEELGVEKPSAQFFERVIAKVNCDKSKTIVLGDNESTDIAGAVASGLDSCLFDLTASAETEADYSIKSLTELLEIV